MVIIIIDKLRKMDQYSNKKNHIEKIDSQRCNFNVTPNYCTFNVLTNKLRRNTG